MLVVSKGLPPTSSGWMDSACLIFGLWNYFVTKSQTLR